MCIKEWGHIRKNAVTYDKADFSSFDNNKKTNLQMMLKVVAPHLPPLADKIPSLCCCEKKQTA